MYRTVVAASWLMATKAQVVWTNEAFLCLIDLKKSFAKFFVARATSRSYNQCSTNGKPQALETWFRILVPTWYQFPGIHLTGRTERRSNRI